MFSFFSGANFLDLPIKKCLLSSLALFILVSSASSYSHPLRAPSWISQLPDEECNVDYNGRHHLVPWEGVCFIRDSYDHQRYRSIEEAILMGDYHGPGDRDEPISDSSNHGAGNNNTCNPINISTGNKYFTQADYTSAGISPLRWELHYNSHQNLKIWSSDYRQRLIIGSSYIWAERNDGQLIKFSADNYEGPSHRPERLTRRSSYFEIRLPNNTVETYGRTDGNLLWITYPSGIVHSLGYSLTHDDITVTRLGETLTLHIVDENVIKTTFPNGTSVEYDWDTSGVFDRLTQVTREDGSTLNYLYENVGYPHFVTGIIDENGNRISSVAYDDHGRAISSEVGTPNSGIERTEITYHDDGSRTVTNSLGKQNTYHFTQFNGEYKMTQVEGHASANCAAANQAYTYDTNGFMASKTDWKGNTTTYVNNDRGLEISRTEASGTPQARTITTEWHPTFNLRTKVTEPERETTFTYDSHGRLTSQEVTVR